MRSANPEERRAALVGWARFVVAWQLLVVVIAGAWIAPFALHHSPGLAWTAAPIGLIAGTAIPLQVALFGITRATR
ncbi:MAG: hypothetical protein NVS9B1_12120 [Candidatus Dormibacteraceae bacterium]